MHDFWAFGQRYPGAVVAKPCVGDFLRLTVVSVPPEGLVEEVNEGLISVPSMVVKDATEWHNWVDFVAPHIRVARQPGMLVRDARE